MSDKNLKVFLILTIGTLVYLNVIANKMTCNELDNLKRQVAVYNADNRRYFKLLGDAIKRNVEIQTKYIEVTKSIIKRQKEIIKKFKEMGEFYKGLDIRKISEANVLVTNLTEGSQGSGTHIKINDESYILTCAHLFEKNEDLMTVVLNDYESEESTKKEELILVKIDEKKDLALLKIVNRKWDYAYLDLASQEPTIGDKVWVIGNPIGRDDVITYGKFEGRWSRLWDGVTASSYFGNSGGAMLNYKGKVIGVLSAVLRPFWRYPFMNRKENKMTVLSLVIPLKSIKEFLKGVK